MSKTVKSPEEFAADKDIRKEVVDKVKAFQEALTNRLDKIKEAEPPDYRDIVKAKLDKDGLSYSSLKKFRESPIAYIHHITKDYAEETWSTKRGKVVDCLVTQPDKFDDWYFIVPEKVPARSNLGKGINMIFDELAGNKKVLTGEELDEAYDIVEALYTNDDAREKMLEIHNPQKSFTFTHKRTGFKIRGILDWEGPPAEDGGPEYVVDMKTAADGSNEDYPYKTRKKDLWYQGQIGTYLLYYKARWQFPDFYQVVVENKKPYNVNVFRVSDKMRATCIEEVEALLTTFKHCYENNLWHKSYDFVRDNVLKYQTLELPPYYKPKFT